MAQEKSYLAIEFATSAVKLVEIRQGIQGLSVIEARSIAALGTGTGPASDVSLKQAAREILGGRKLKMGQSFLAINSPHMCFSQFIIPKIPKKEWTDTLKWKMKDEMPFSVDNAVLDYDVVEVHDGEGSKKLNALVAAMPHQVAHHPLEFFSSEEAQNLKLAFASFSISDLKPVVSKSDHDLVAVVDIGHLTTELALYEKGKLSFLRKIAFGGAHVTQVLMQPLMTEAGLVSLNWEEAEKVKCTEDVFAENNPKLAAGKIEISKLYALLRPEVEKLAAELNRSLDYYAHTHGVQAEQIVLTGGGSRLKGLAPFLEQSLGVPIGRMDFPSRFQLADGMSAGELDPYYRLISILSDRLAKRTDFVTRARNYVEPVIRSLSYGRVAGAALALSLALAGGMSWRYFDIVGKTQDVRRQISNLKAGFSESNKIQELELQINQGAILASAILENEPYWEEVFREVAHVFPDSVLLTGLGYEDETFVLEGKISKSGAETSVSKLLLALEGPIFQKATLVNTVQVGDDVTFTIRAKSGKK